MQRVRANRGRRRGSAAPVTSTALDLEAPAGADWLPTYYTAPLSPAFPSDADRLLRAVEMYWRSDETPPGEAFELDDWQRWLLRALLERYPDDHADPALAGRLRYRQAVVSMGRQNGKSLLAAILGFYGLTLHEPGPLVVGLASTREQAGIVYERVRYVIENTPALKIRYKPTGTRGIRHRGGTGTYLVKPAKGAALQGLPISLGLFDELHISPPAMWGAIVNGQRTRRDGLLTGFTTAGDDDSELLKTLYEIGHRAVTGDPAAQRFGFFLWEAPEGGAVTDPAAIAAANPSVACGRVPAATVQSDARLMPEADQQRYILNRWVSSVNSWMPMSYWHDAGGSAIAGTPSGTVFGIHRTTSWEYASIVAAAPDAAGTLTVELVASLVRPNVDQLEQLATRLAERTGRATFTMDRFALSNLAERLSTAGLDVETIGGAQQIQAAQTTYARLVDGKLRHADDPLLTAQMARARRRNVGDGAWRISQADSTTHVDAVIAMVYAVYRAEAAPAYGIQLF